MSKNSRRFGLLSLRMTSSNSCFSGFIARVFSVSAKGVDAIAVNGSKAKKYNDSSHSFIAHSDTHLYSYYFIITNSDSSKSANVQLRRALLIITQAKKPFRTRYSEPNSAKTIRSVRPSVNLTTFLILLLTFARPL